MPIPLRFKAAWDDSALMAGIRRTSTKINRLASWQPGGKRGVGFGRGGGMGGGLIAGGLVTAGIAKVTNEADALYNLSRKTGIATTNLAALAEMSKTANIETEQLAGAVVKMQNNLAKNEPATAEALHALGLSLAELDAMKANEQLITIGAAIAKMNEGSRKANVTQSIFGKGGTDLFEFFDTIGSLDMAKISENAKKMGQAAETLAKAKDVIDQYMFGVNARAATMLADSITAGKEGSLKGIFTAMLGRTKTKRISKTGEIGPPVRIGTGEGALDVGRKEVGLTKGRGMGSASGLGIYGTAGGTGSGGQAYGYIKRGDAKIAKQADANLKALQYQKEAAEKLTTIDETLRSWDQ